jgi:peptide/nickel transport system substrate-binding protein
MLKKIVLALVLTCGASFAFAQQPKMGGVANAVIQPEPQDQGPHHDGDRRQ